MPLRTRRSTRRPDLGIVARWDGATAEGWIVRVQPKGDCAEVHLLLADGNAAVVEISREDATWLELKAGQIVGLRHRALPSDPGVALVGRCVNAFG